MRVVFPKADPNRINVFIIYLVAVIVLYAIGFVMWDDAALFVSVILGLFIAIGVYTGYSNIKSKK